MSSSKIILSALAGLAIGSIAGILLAPDKGSSTRRKIANKGDDYIDDLKEKMTDYIDRVKDNYASAAQTTEHFADKVTSMKDDIKKAIS
jgi:gas vesicle protein